jgi:outer membrane receptor protein involved in Fe transport
MNHFLEADFVAPQSSALNIGVPIAYQPKNIVSIWNRYQASTGSFKGLIIGGGLRYQSDASYGGDFNHSQLFIPAFTVIDALVGYDTKLCNHPLQLRINVKNVFDKIYRDGAGGAFANARTIIASVSTRF